MCSNFIVFLQDENETRRVLNLRFFWENGIAVMCPTFFRRRMRLQTCVLI